MFDRILKFSIEQRGLIMLATLGLCFLGVYNFQRLPIDAVPDITNVQVQINTEAPGYSPLEVESLITFPIEVATLGLPRLKKSRSLSRYGLSQVTVIFEDGTDIYFARNLISQRLQEARGTLPPSIEPIMGPIATGLGEIFLWTMEVKPSARKSDGTVYTTMDLRTLQDWVIRPQLLTVPGVTEVNSIGGYDRQYHVTPDPQKLIAYGLSFRDVLQALAENNNNVGAGYIEHYGEQYLIRAPGRVYTLDEIRNIVLGSFQGVPIYIRDVAEVLLGKELRTGAATKDGKETVLGTAFMLMGANSRTVAKAVGEKLHDANRSLPEGVVAKPIYDRTTLVDLTIATVRNNLLEGAALVIAVLHLLLGNIRAALITAMVIPLSMLFAITGMVTEKVSANLMSLGAIDFGIIVDGAVVTVENSMRHLAEAQGRLQRSLTVAERLKVAFESSEEARRAILFGQLIIMVVYLPIFALTGVEGKMFHPMALTVVMALLGAMILSITFVPAAVALFVSGRVSEKENLVIRLAKKAYLPALDFTLRSRPLVVTTAVVIVVLSGLLGTRLGTEFVPSLDEGDLSVQALRMPGTGLMQSTAMQAALEKRLQAFPEVETVFARIGTAKVATDPMPPNISDTYIMLRPREKWPDPGRPKEDLVNAMAERIARLPGSNHEFTQPIELRFNELLAGVRADVAEEVVEAAMGGKVAGKIYEGDRRFDLVVRLPEAYRVDVEALKRLPILLPQG